MELHNWYVASLTENNFCFTKFEFTEIKRSYIGSDYCT